MKKKKSIVITAVLTAALLTGVTAPAEAAQSVSVTLPGFPVTLNGVTIENTTRQYPLLVYKNITYVPMTYYDCRFLGLETTWNQTNGLGIQKAGVTGAYYEDAARKKNTNRAVAKISSGKITVNGKQILNTNEPYPLLLYRDVTYFPLTWRFAVNEFGWKYQFDQKTGLVITSDNKKTETITLEDGRKEDFSVFSFTIDETYLYYEGEQGKLYRRPLTTLQSVAKREMISEVPYEDDYFVGYPIVTFYTQGQDVYYQYHSGGATFGGDYLYRLSDGKKPELILDRTYDSYVDLGEFKIQIAGTVIGGRPAVPMTMILKDGTKRDLGPEGYYFSLQANSYNAKRNQLYVLASAYDKEADGAFLYAVDLEDSSMKKMSGIAVDSYVVREDFLYYTDGRDVYCQNLNTEEEQRINGVQLGTHSQCAPVTSGLYFSDSEKRLNFRENGTGEIIVLNEKGILKNLFVQSGYVVACFQETADNPYRLMIWDEEGNQVYTSADVVEKAVINENHVLVYQLAGTAKLVKVQL